MWIPSRGVNGEYGYLNTETGEFRTTLPNSREEKQKEQQKQRKAALITHSARQAKYERTDAKRRNHSDETVKKQVSVPIMTMNPDGTFANNYVQQMAPNESSLSTHDPIAEFYIGTKALNPVFNNLNNVVNYTKNKIISNQLSRQIKNFDGTVSENYFNSPNNWYRITESPEVYGIKEMGKNVTTIDAADMYIPSNQFRLDVIGNNLTFRDGYWYKPLKRTLNFSKNGSAHGNTSQAAKGHLWQSTTSGSNRFPQVILEGDMPVQTYRGFNPTTGIDSRTSFHLVDSETIPMGARIGFHTGEMPIEGLRSFTRLSNGKYRYDGPVIPYKTIQVNK